MTSHTTLAKNLFKSADKLRKSIDAAEYKHIVLGLVFLKYISDGFQIAFDTIQKEEGDTEDRDNISHLMRFLCQQMHGGATLWQMPSKAILARF